jgi:Matrixin/Putative Ig domain
MTLSWARSYRAFTACFLGLFLLLAGVVPGFSFALNGYKWPDGTQITMHLQLTRFSPELQDGSASWNDSAADALNLWNQYVGTVKFVQADPVGPSGGDGANSVFFSSTIYGQSFGSTTLAVTVNYSSSGSGVFAETDVIFNDARTWNSYRGPIQGAGATATYDFHRVALHEFGHVLGLDHPDQHGQSVVALMNSIISNLDELADDDIAGVTSLYGLRVTSNLNPSPVEIRNNFSYQISANNQPTRYEATGLPPGLQLDANTGLMSGTPTAVGTFSVSLIVHGNRADITATLRIQVMPRQITSALMISSDIGASFSYFMHADNNPTGFEAQGLPSGLQLDPVTGAITGVADLSGTFVVTLIAHGSYGDAIATMQITVRPLSTPTPILATFSIHAGAIAVDPRRPYVYVSSSFIPSVVVIDTSTLTLKKTIPVNGLIGDMAISADGNRLWLSYDSNGGSSTLRSIDLTTLTALPDLPVAMQPAQIREGLNGQVFVSDLAGKIWSVDSASGATQSQIASLAHSPAIEIGLDRTTLFVGELRGAGMIDKYDVSGSTPRLLQSAYAGDYGYTLTLSNTGKFICLVTNPSLLPYGTREFSATNLSQTVGTFQMMNAVKVAFSPDDSVAYQTGLGQSYVGVYDTASCQLLRKIQLGDNATAGSVAVDNSGSYLFVAGDASGGSAWVRVYSTNHSQSALTTPPHSLLNISTRLQSQGGDNALVGGFIINGSEPKKVAVRALGPSLPLPGKLANPVLQLYDSNQNQIAQNDNWNAHRSDVLTAGLAPSDEHDSVIITTLQPGSYTAVVRGYGNSSGIALAEVYDLASGANSRLANVSTRGRVQSGDNVMIGGFIVGGDQPTNLVLRGMGPSLANLGVPDALLDPVLEVYDSNGALLAQDDDWRQYQEQLLIQSGLAPTDDRESALFLVMDPGAYTAIVRGKNDSVGVGLVEVYNLDAN